MSAKEISLELRAPAELLKLAREVVEWWSLHYSDWDEGKGDYVYDPHNPPSFVRTAEKVLSKRDSA